MESNIDKLLEDDSKKKPYSFYIETDLYKKFMKTCNYKTVAGSKAISALMEDFIDTYGEH